MENFYNFFGLNIELVILYNSEHLVEEQSVFLSILIYSILYYISINDVLLYIHDLVLYYTINN